MEGEKLDGQSLQIAHQMVGLVSQFLFRHNHRYQD